MTVFENEETVMAAAAEQQFRPEFPESVYFREHRRQYKKTDALIARVDTGAVRARLENEEPPVCGPHSYEFTTLNARGPDRLKEILPNVPHLRPDRMDDIREFAEAGLIRFDDVGKAHAVAPREVISTLVALEYKRTDAAIAIEQAEERLTYSDYAYVVMDGDRTRKAKALFSELESPRIGLIELRKEDFTVLVEPTEMDVQSSYGSMLNGMVYHAFLDQNHPDQAEKLCSPYGLEGPVEDWSVW